MPTPSPSPVPPWFDWGWSAVPNELQWVGFWLGLIAFVLAILAIPSVVQSMFGQPKIKVMFETRTIRDEVGSPRAVKECHLQNEPVQNWWLRLCRVRRTTADDVSAWFTIREAGSERIVHDTVPAKIQTQINGGLQERISLPASFQPSGFPVTVTPMGPESETLVFAGETMEILALGTYLVSVLVTSGEDKFRAESQLVVGRRAEDVTWRDLSVVPRRRSRG